MHTIRERNNIDEASVHFYVAPSFFKCWRLNAVDTIGNCRNPVFSFGVSQHMHKITNL